MERAFPLVVERILSERALAALEPEWLELERTSGNTLPFRTFAWVGCWWKHMHESRLALEDSLAIRVIRNSAGRLVGVAPLMLTQRPGVGPVRTRCLQFIGADPNVTEIRGALCEPDLETTCYAALHEDLKRSERELDWAKWSGIDERSGARAVLGEEGVIWSEGVSCYLVDLPQTWEELRASRPANLRESLRKCYRSLERDGLDWAFEVVASDAELGPALEDFFRLHAARARLEDTIRHKDVFQHAACRAFLLDVCRRMSRRGALRVFRLRVAGQLAATRIGFVLGGCLYLYYSGFDPAFASYGVATTVVAEAMKQAIRERLQSVNLSVGADRSKLRWRPRAVAFREAHLISSSPLGRAKHQAFSAAARAVSRLAAGRYAQQLLARRAP